MLFLGLVLSFWWWDKWFVEVLSVEYLVFISCVVGILWGCGLEEKGI